MPRFSSRIFAGLAILALAFAPGAEAVVCGADEYLEMDGAWTSGGVKNAPKCTACPSGMTNAAGVAGRYGDSANPILAVTLAAAVAQASANSNLLTWCDVKPGYWLSTAATATSPGATTACGTTRAEGSGVTTSPKTIILAATSVQTAAAQCVLRSACAANTYLSTSAGATPTASCTACPAGMEAAAGDPTVAIAGVATEIAKSASSTAKKIFTFCDVSAGSWLSTAVTTAIPGAATGCGIIRADGGDGTGATATTSPKTTVTGALSVQTAAAQCVLRSNCPANTYLSTSAGATPTASCTACPAGMEAAAGDPTVAIAGVATEIAKSASSTAKKIFTFCNVDSGYRLSTAVTTAVPGATTACAATSTRSFAKMITGATSVNTEAEVCLTEKNLVGATGPAGPAGATGATGATGPAGRRLHTWEYV